MLLKRSRRSEKINILTLGRMSTRSDSNQKVLHGARANRSVYMNLSLVIPCYNEEKIITENIKYILNQSVPPNEVIFVNNGSIDSSMGIVESYRELFKKQGIELKVIEEPQRPQEYARIKGFREAKGDLIGMIDVDTLLSKHWIKVAKESFEKYQDLAAIGGPVYFSNLSIFSRLQWFLIF